MIKYVVSKYQIAEFLPERNPTERRLSREEALSLYGAEILEEIETEGVAVLPKQFFGIDPKIHGKEKKMDFTYVSNPVCRLITFKYLVSMEESDSSDIERILDEMRSYGAAVIIEDAFIANTYDEASEMLRKMDIGKY